MGELFSTKSLLDVLADSEQTLHPQFSIIPKPKAKRFACFADLTTEIRLQIWTLTFPPTREFNIAAHRRKSKNRQTTHACGPNHCIHAPVSLFINRESRYETLFYYHPIVRDRMVSGRSIATETLFWRVGDGVSGDVLYVNVGSILGVTIEQTEFDWVKAWLANNTPQAVEQIESLEIREWGFDQSWREIFGKGEVRLLGELKGLKRVNVVLPRWYRWTFFGGRFEGLVGLEKRRVEEVKEIRETVEGFLERKGVVRVSVSVVIE